MFAGGKKCVKTHPFGEAAKISPVLVSGCSASGTQFYGEKCAGSDFSGLPEAFQKITYGKCGPLKDECECFTYLEAASPGCYAVAVPNPGKQVLMRAGGCVKANKDDDKSKNDDEPKKPPLGGGLRLASQQAAIEVNRFLQLTVCMLRVLC